MLQQTILAGALALTATLISAPSQADYVYPMHVERSSNKAITALATKINDSQFVTDAELLKGATAVYLIDNSVTPAAKIVATVLFSDPDKRLAVLSVSNISGKAVTLALQEQPIGGQLLLLTDSGSTPSLAQRLEPVKDLATGDIYVHTALYTEKQWAAPLLNNCQQFLGVSVFESSLFNRMQQPETIAYALSATTVKATLTEHKIAFTEATTRCLSDVEQATANAEQAAKDAAAAKAAQQSADAAAKQKLEEIQQQAEEAKKQADKLLKDAKAAADKIAAENAEKLKQVEEAIKKAEEDRVALEKAKQEAEEKAKQEAEKNKTAEQHKQYLVLGAAVIVLVLLLIFTLVMRKRKQAMQSKDAELQKQAKAASGLEQDNERLAGKMAQLQRSFDDILLDGETHDGRKIRLKINGKALLQSGDAGQIIGRESTQVEHPLAEAEVSRKHLRIWVQQGKVMVEDLQSQNGSWVNETKLSAGQPAELSAGSVLRLSSISFKVSFHTP